MAGQTEADDICAPCPSRRGNSCESAGKIEALDAAHAKALRLNAGDELSWGEALDRMRALPETILDDICGPCQWRDFGMCTAALKRLKSQ